MRLTDLYIANDLYGFVIMTGDTASPETAAFRGRWDNVMMHKPFTFEAVREHLKDVLNTQ